MTLNLSILLLAFNRSTISCNRPSPPTLEHCFQGNGRHVRLCITYCVIPSYIFLCGIHEAKHIAFILTMLYNVRVYCSAFYAVCLVAR